jgi:hypothetical protein
VFGKRKDTGNPAEESKPYSGGVPHCFPQVEISSVIFFNQILMAMFISLDPVKFNSMDLPAIRISFHQISSKKVLLKKQFLN